MSSNHTHPVEDNRGFVITKGDYQYVNGIPPGCKGHVYRVLAFVMAVPTYQEQVLVKAMTGPDKGLLFVCSPANFSTRYVRMVC